MAKQHLVIDNSTLGQFFLLIEEGMITIGSNRNPVETLIRNVRVSRIHCDLEIEGEPVEISSDTGAESPAGTQELAAGQVLHVGDCDLHLEAPDEQPAVEEPTEEPAVGLVDDDSPGLLPEDAGIPADPAAAATARRCKPGPSGCASSMVPTRAGPITWSAATTSTSARTAATPRSSSTTFTSPESTATCTSRGTRSRSSRTRAAETPEACCSTARKSSPSRCSWATSSRGQLAPAARAGDRQ